MGADVRSLKTKRGAGVREERQLDRFRAIFTRSLSIRHDDMYNHMMKKADPLQAARDWDAIILRAKCMDAAAFDEIVDLYAGRLCGFFQKLLGPHSEAEDLTQEVFVRVVRMIGEYTEQGQFDAWLFRIASNLARDCIRKKQRTPTVLSSEISEEGEVLEEVESSKLRIAPPPEQALVKAEDMDLLSRSLEKLPQVEREVVLLRHYGQLSFAEIAEYMGTPIGTALARAHRGLEKLREWMESVS